MSEMPSGTPKVDRKSMKRWWRPYSKTPTFTIAVIIAISAVVIGLEVALWRSERGKGLGDADVSSYIRYTSSYVPPLVMLAIQLLVGTIGCSSR